MVICLQRGADLHTAQLMPLPATHCRLLQKSRLVLPFWYRLTRVATEKGPLYMCLPQLHVSTTVRGCKARKKVVPEDQKVQTQT